MGDQSRIRVLPEKLTVPMVFEHLKSKKVIDLLHKDVLARIKETPSYKRMKEVAVMHMSEILTDPSKTIPCPEDRVEKKKQIAEIGLLALSIDSSMCQIVSENLGERTESLVNSAMKELMGTGVKKPTKNATKLPKRTVVAREICDNRIVPEYNEETYNKSINAILGSDNETNASNDSLSVSSAHTSDLSSFDAEIDVSDKKGGLTIQKKVLSKFAKELRLRNKFSNAGQEEEMEQQTEVDTSKLLSLSPKLKQNSPDDKSRRMQSKRIRKPNKKYASKDLVSWDTLRQKELLDVQRDLRIINGTDSKLSKGESPKSPMSKKRKAN